MNDRLNQILDIARNNAREGIDQNRIADYDDNFRETIAGRFPDWTGEEAQAAEVEFYRIIREWRNKQWGL